MTTKSGKLGIYEYVNRQGKTIDLSSWIDGSGMTKEHVAHLARHKGRVHGLARALDAFKSSGYTHDQVMQLAHWILSGKSLSSIS
jgi:hypothetical protein